MNIQNTQIAFLLARCKKLAMDGDIRGAEALAPRVKEMNRLMPGLVNPAEVQAVLDLVETAAGIADPSRVAL